MTTSFAPGRDLSLPLFIFHIAVTLSTFCLCLNITKVQIPPEILILPINVKRGQVSPVGRIRGVKLRKEAEKRRKLGKEAGFRLFELRSC